MPRIRTLPLVVGDFLEALLLAVLDVVLLVADVGLLLGGRVAGEGDSEERDVVGLLDLVEALLDRVVDLDALEVRDLGDRVHGDLALEGVRDGQRDRDGLADGLEDDLAVLGGLALQEEGRGPADIGADGAVHPDSDLVVLRRSLLGGLRLNVLILGRGSRVLILDRHGAFYKSRSTAARVAKEALETRKTRGEGGAF